MLAAMSESRRRSGRTLFLWVAALFALVAALVGIGILSAAAFQQAVGDENNRTRAGGLYAQSNATLLAAAAVYDALQDAERGQRGYALTQNPVFLDPYNENVSRVQGRIDQLDELIGPEGDESPKIEALRTIAQLKLDEMADVVRKVDEGRIGEARRDISSGYGRRLMQQINELIIEIRQDEEERLTERRDALLDTSRQSAEAFQRLALFGVALLGAALIAVAGLALLLIRAYRSAEREQIIETENEALEAAVAERTRELVVANEKLIAEAESRESAENRLRQAQRLEAVGQLTGGIAHDFNNMLSVVIGNLDLLKRRVDDDPKVSRLIENALEGADRAATLTSRLLAFSRQQSLKPEVIDLNELMRGMEDFLRRTLGETVRVEMDLSEDSPDVFVDPSELENVIINLGANARDAMPKGGRLTVRTARVVLHQKEDHHGQILQPGTYARIDIEDTGEGMPPEVLEKVYEPFFTTKPVGKGTGLGLSQVQGFVIQSGGSIDIKSEQGQGTVIGLLLPEGQQREDLVSLDAEPAGDLPEAKPGESVLIVEDQDQLRALTVDVLRELGYRVEAAASAGEALKILEEQDGFTLLFTDIVMPDRRGDELAGMSRAFAPDMTILYTSGFTQAAGIEERELNPPADLLRKPYTVDQLAHAIRRAIDGTSA